MNRPARVLAEVMNGRYERSRAAAKGSYERRYERDFSFASDKAGLPLLSRLLSMQQVQCAARTRLSGGPPAVAERPKRQKVERPRFAFCSRACARLWCVVTSLDRTPPSRAQVVDFRFVDLHDVLQQETRTATPGTLAPCSKSRHRHAPSTSASFPRQEKQKTAETAEL
jgi:hypothetical protein